MKSIIAVIAGGILSACALFVPTLVDQGVVRLDIKKTEPVYIAFANAYQDAGEMVVGGTAKYPISKRYGIFNGHVDVSVIEPGGRRLESKNVKVMRRRIPKTMGREASFTTRFPINPIKGTIINIAYHNSMHSKIE